MILAAAGAAAAEDRDSLRYFKNYFVTGDYAVAGVGLRARGVGGMATGTIAMNTVPDGADVIAAFLYWQTVETTAQPSSANGFFRGKAIVGLSLGSPANPACWSSGGTTGPRGSAGRVYRADVLRYLPVDKSRSIRVANGQHEVRLPDSGGTGNGNAPFTNGATLVVVYRIVVPGNPSAMPLRSVVIYDGAATINKQSDNFKQRMAGYYQASNTPNARLTPIVGNGQAGFTVEMQVNDGKLPSSVPGALGSRWDSPVYSFPLERNSSSFQVEVEPKTNQTCLTYAAFVASMEVADSDRDGLLDTWETRGVYWNPGTATQPAAFGGCADFPGQPCVNLPAMGAVNGQRDIFLEMDWMEGANGDKPGTHSHRPKVEALTQVAAAFKRQGIRLHFDVGNNYQNLATGPDFVVTPAAQAQGGEVIQESSLGCPNARTPISSCAYVQPYSVVSFKKGYQSVRDGNAPLGLPRRFQRNRKDIFHYVLWAHAFAGPVDPVTGKPLTPDPKSYSGAADRPGGDILITLGLWRSNIPENDQVGSALVQAGTLMHELGHNLGLSHAGIFRAPNCMPNYASVMNYLYQSRGLTPLNGGDKVIDFSAGALPSLNEQALLETPASMPPYRVRYYGPVTNADPPSSAAQLRCDGSPITDGVRMIRLENDFTNFIDWDHDRALTPGALRLDIDFSGTLGDGPNGGNVFLDSNDWRNLNLQQVGARLNVGGLSTDIGALELGVSDLGALELGALELGALELGVSDLGVSDLGALELGALELGELDYETAVLSSIDPPPPPSPSCPTCGLRSTAAIDRITLNWTAPDTGAVLSYNIYRASPAAPGVFTLLKSVPGGAAALTTDDVPNGTTTLFNTLYTYYVTSLVRVNASIVESVPSNQATGIVKRLFIQALSQGRYYLSPNLPFTYAATGLELPAPAGIVCNSIATQTSDAGTYPIVCTGPATVPGNPLNAIVYTNGNLIVQPLSQTIFFAALPAKTLGDAPFAVSATVNSPLTVTFTATGACSVSGTTVTLLSQGTCSITASQPGTNNFLAATPVTQSFTVQPAPPVSFNYADFNSTAGLRLNGSATTVGGVLRATSNVGQASATWFSQPVVVSSGFTTQFRFRATPVTNPPADGIAFVIQTGPDTALGGGGGGIGYHGLAGSLAVEFDTYLNQTDLNDPNANHIAVQSNGTGANTALHGAATLAINSTLPFTIADGNVHDVRIVYVPGSLTVTVDGNLLVTASVNLPTLLALPADGKARVGLTSATGASGQTSDLLSWWFQPAI